MQNIDFREKATVNILQAAYEASSWEDFGAQALPALEGLFNTSLSILFRSDERGPGNTIAGAAEPHRIWTEQYFHCDPMVTPIQNLNQGILQASQCPEWKGFLKHPVYEQLARSSGVHDYLILKFTETIPYKPGAVQLLLARGHRQPSFSREEQLRAENLMPPLKALGRWIDRSENLHESCSTLEGILDAEGRHKVAFDIDGNLLCASRSAEKLIGLQAQGRFRISEELRAAVRRFGDLAKGRIFKSPSPQVNLFGKNARPIQVTLRLAKTRSGNRFVLAEVERADLPFQLSQLAELALRYGLTKTETEVLALLAEGLSDREIAQRLFVSRETVHTHAGHLFGKLGVSTRLQAALVAHGKKIGSA